ncbi:MAG: hypothetical protein OEV21_00560 [Thermoplasmata archaeon]|nr:hypothetical protein [Thermoplasmata archaeon]
MAEARHTTEEPKKCDVRGCSEPAERSISSKKVEKSGLSIPESTDKRVHLCKKHYREFKKKTKKDREVERLGW